MLQQIYDETIKKDEFIEIFTKYYGEAHRKKITKLINNTTFVLVPQRPEHFKLSKLINSKLPELKDFKIGTISNFLISAKTCILNEDLTPLLNYPCAKYFGLSEETLTIGENGKHQFKNKDFQKATILKILQICENTDEFNINQADQELKQTRITQINKQAENYKSNLIKNFINQCQTLEPNQNAQMSDSPLNEIYLELLFDLTLPLDEFNNEKSFEAQIVETQLVKNFNEVFETSYTSWEQFTNDPKFINIIQLYKDSLTKFEKINKLQSIKEEQVNKNAEIIQKYCPNLSLDVISSIIKDYDKNPLKLGSALSTFSETNNKPLIMFPINEKFTISTILHEINHICQVHINKKTKNNITGLNVEENESHRALNEAINEYLTQDLMKEVDTSHLSKSISLYANSSYNSNIDLIRPFLDEYKKILKEVMISKNPMLLKDKLLRKENFNKLTELLNDKNSCKEHEYLKELTQITGTQFASVKDIIENKDLLKNQELTYNLKKYINLVLETDSLCQNLIEHKQELLRGKHVDLTKKSLLNSLQNPLQDFAI